MVRTSSRALTSTSVNGKKSMSSALAPVAALSVRRMSSLLTVPIPQSVWWITMHSRVPSSCVEMTIDRSASSLARPPALRTTCASPTSSPRNLDG